MPPKKNNTTLPVVKEIIALDPSRQYIITVGSEEEADALLEQVKANLDDSKGLRIAILVGEVKAVFEIQKSLDKK